MQYNPEAAAASQLPSMLRTAGATVPEELSAAVATYRARRTKLETLRSTVSVADLLATLDSPDPAASPEAAAVAAFAALAAQKPNLERAADDALIAAVRASRDDIVAALAEAVERDAIAARAALDVLGGVDLDDPAAILGVGGEAARAWVDAQDAEARLIAAVAAVATLNSADGGAYDGVKSGAPHAQTAVLAGNFPADFASILALGIKSGDRLLARMQQVRGWAPRLASPKQFAAWRTRYEDSRRSWNAMAAADAAGEAVKAQQSSSTRALLAGAR